MQLVQLIEYAMEMVVRQLDEWLKLSYSNALHQVEIWKSVFVDNAQVQKEKMEDGKVRVKVKGWKRGVKLVMALLGLL